MEKKLYLCPEMEVIKLKSPFVMQVTSPVDPTANGRDPINGGDD